MSTGATDLGESMRQFELGFLSSTSALSLPIGINEHNDPHTIGEEHKKLGMQSKTIFVVCFLYKNLDQQLPPFSKRLGNAWNLRPRYPS